MEDIFSSLLSDPEKLQQAISVASSLINGGESANDNQTQNENNSEEYTQDVDIKQTFAQVSHSGFDEDPSAFLMQKAMPVIMQIAKNGQNAVSCEKKELLRAVKPFVTDSVQHQIDHAVRLVGMAKMAQAALHQFGINKGGDGHV